MRYFTGKKVYLFFAFTVLFLSCRKKWDEKARVEFDFSVSTSSSKDYLMIKEGYVELRSFRFFGARERGSDVEFSSSLPPGTHLQLVPSPAVPATVSHEVPQGIYDNIDMSLDLSHDGGVLPKIYLSGYYKDGHKQYPLVLDMNLPELLQVQAQAAGGGRQIILAKDRPARASVTFDAAGWFRDISSNMLDEALIADTDGKILISNSENKKMHDLILSGIKSTCKVVFE